MLIPLVFMGYGGVQVMMLILMHSFYIIWYGTISPFAKHRTTLMEGLNECLFMFLCYHLLFFGNYVSGIFKEDQDG